MGFNGLLSHALDCLFHQDISVILFYPALNVFLHRNTFNLDVNWEARKTDSTGFEQVVTGVEAGFGRQLSKRTKANISASLNHTDFDDTAGRIDNSLTVRGDLTYQIFEDANVVLSYTRTQRRSNRNGNGLTENAVVVGLSKQF